MPPATLATLVLAASANAREAAISIAISEDLAKGQITRHAVLLEGLPDGHGQLEALLDGNSIPVIRIAAGCLCCSGNVILRVSINRLLRHKPQRLFIGLATPTHQAQLRTLLQQAPYDAWLVLADECVLQSEIAPEPQMR